MRLALFIGLIIIWAIGILVKSHISAPLYLFCPYTGLLFKYFSYYTVLQTCHQLVVMWTMSLVIHLMLTGLHKRCSDLLLLMKTMYTSVSYSTYSSCAWIICSNRCQGLRGNDHMMLTMMRHLLKRVLQRDLRGHH